MTVFSVRREMIQFLEDKETITLLEGRETIIFMEMQSLNWSSHHGKTSCKMDHSTVRMIIVLWWRIMASGPSH